MIGQILRTALPLLLCLQFQCAFAQDETTIESLLGSAFACEITEQLLADMPVEPLYRQTDSSCDAVIPRERVDLQLYSDAQCEQPLAFEATALQEYCRVTSNGDLLGTGEDIVEPAWTLTPGSRMDVGARSLSGLTQPYMQRLVYRTVDTDRGSCTLEMRVYSRHPAASNQRSLIALHGGSWSSRGFGFFGLELTIPHLVEKGFVVYAPFYRLLGTKDDIGACNDSTIDDITEDVSSALDWVKDNAVTFGSAGTPVVFGQSAGAHLALSLAVNRSDEVSGAVMFYPPTDFSDFVLRVQGGFYSNEAGIDILELLLGDVASNIDINVPQVVGNSFPAIIEANRNSLPPMFLLHGAADDLVELRQSQRVCDALAARPMILTDEAPPPVDLLRTIQSCEQVEDMSTDNSDTQHPDSVLHAIREGQHALDVCVSSFELPTDACFSGSEDSRRFVSESIGDAVEFAVMAFDATSVLEVSEPTPIPMTGERSSGGGGGVLWLSVLLLIGRFAARATFTAALCVGKDR